MATPVILNLTATTTEQYKDQVCYGFKLLKNDGEYDILLGRDKPTSEEGFILLRVGEAFEDWDVSPFGRIYYKSIGGNSSFRLYSQLLTDGK